MKKRDSLIELQNTYSKPISKLLETAHAIHLQHFPKETLQASTLLSIKTGGCPENCTYCPQSAHFKTGLTSSSLLASDEILKAARQAKKNGATRFCLGAAWRKPPRGPVWEGLLKTLLAIQQEGLETCATWGLLTLEQAKELKQAQLDYYNHNLDCNESFYSNIVTTRTYQDRIQTLLYVREAGLKLCTGGILGLGETEGDRIDFLNILTSFHPPIESLTVNLLIPFPGTPLENRPPVPFWEVLRFLATLRIHAPSSRIRLSAGRERLSEEAQFLCFYAGVNSFFLGERLLTAPHPSPTKDLAFLKEVGYALEPGSK